MCLVLVLILLSVHLAYPFMQFIYFILPNHNRKAFVVLSYVTMEFVRFCIAVINLGF